METDFHRSDELILARLRNYELPSDLETTEITLEIEDVEKRLQHIKLAAGASNGASNALSNGEHDILERRLAYCRAFIAPVRRLPREILAEISHIILASVRRRSPSPPQQLRPTRALVILSQTCSFWRSVIFATATLWYDIRIPSLFRDARDAQLVEMHLQYSGNSPLDIQIHNSGAHLIPDMDSARKISEGLLSHRERWREISIVGSRNWLVLDSACSVVLRQTNSLRFPLLGSLTLEDTKPGNLDIFLAAHLPRLRTIKVHGYPPSSIPYRQLTSLSLVLYHGEIHHPLPGFAQHIAEHFLNLEYLRLEGDLDHLPSETSGDIDLPKLKDLIIESYSESFLVLFLTTFRIPALLSIDIRAPLQDWPHVEFTSLLIRSQRLSSLTRLSLKWTQITDEQLLEILRQTENLEELTIVEDHTSTLSSSLFQAMSITSTTTAATVIVPKLQHITFSRSLSEKESPFGIEMVASRARTAKYLMDSPCLPLKSFTISLYLLYKPPEIPMSLGKEDIQALRQSMDVNMNVIAGGQVLIPGFV